MKFRPRLVQADGRLTARVIGGRYRFDALLGRGGTADVYEGLDLRLRRPVAVKVFRPETDDQFEERFNDEGRLLARLQHPGLVAVYDAGQEGGCPYLVMQLIKGTTLRRRIATAPLTLDEVCRIGSALSSALAHVHAADVVHRDIKPSNILLDQKGLPHLSDFGISRLVDNTRHTVTGALVGTAAYMAPEQVLGKGARSAADIYSLGLVLLESLKGELEYAGPPLEAAIARLHRSPVIPSSLPSHLADLLDAMTAQDEKGRPDAHACAQALAAVPADGSCVLSLHRVEPVAESPETGEEMLRGESAAVRTGDAGPATARKTTDRPPVTQPASPGSVPIRTRRALLTAGAALAALGVTLTVTTGDPVTEGKNKVSQSPRRTTAQPVSSPADRPTPESPAAPAPDPAPDPPTSSAGAADKAAEPVTSPAEQRQAPSPAASRREPGRLHGHGHAMPRPKHDKTAPRLTKPKPVKSKPPRKNHKD